MTASEIIRLLNQVPPRYELVVVQGDATHRIHELSFSHDPAQVTLRLVPSEGTQQQAEALFIENTELRDANAGLALELQQLRNGNIPPVSATPNPSASFSHWWNQEGSGMAPRPDEDKSEHTRRLCEIAWSNGEYVAKYPAPEAACLPEPEATIAELNGEVPVITDVAPLPEMVTTAEVTATTARAMSGKTHMITAEVAATIFKRTRKPKNAPFGTA